MADTGGILPVMVGTAGHIDHGKSSLVRALTGVDPDRLKEEKERGLTIDLGFAPLRLSDGRLMGMVDVPGHEKLVRNMVAGSTALDLTLLIVAADDGVMPQTIEHLDILDLLGVRSGVIALTKIDLVPEDVALLAEEEVRALVAGTALESAPIVRVSTVTGEGIEDLVRALEVRASALAPRPHHGPFRMPVQRVFQLKGIGTVVTGIPVSGMIEPGGEVEFLPGGQRAKVRAVQAFGGKVSRAVAGHSTALSVPDAREAGLARGVVAAVPGVFHAGNAVDVELQLTRRCKRVRHRCDVRFHAGTAEVQGRLLLLDADEIGAGAKTVARVVLTEPACVAPGDRFLLRLQNPVQTIGGGRVLRLVAAPKRYQRRAIADELERLRAAGARPEARVLEELTLAGPAGLSPGELGASLAMPVAAAAAVLASLPEVHVHERGNRAFLRACVEAGIDELHRNVDRMLRDKPLTASVKRSALRPSRSLPAPLLDAVVEVLQARGRVRAGAQGRLLFLDRLVPLAAEEQRTLDELVAATEAAGYRPPTLAELAASLGLAPQRAQELVARAVDEGRIEPIGEHLYAAATVQNALRAVRRNCLRHDDVLDIPALRDELGTTRKYLIPLLEYVDGLGLTRLRGGVRCLLPSSAVCQELAALERAASSAGG
jgi:selenocysteine-specific elongation factor